MLAATNHVLLALAGGAIAVGQAAIALTTPGGRPCREQLHVAAGPRAPPSQHKSTVCAILARMFQHVGGQAEEPV